MNDQIITGRALNALAVVIAEVRHRAGGSDWQTPGILDALARATDNPRCSDAGTLVIAATKAASDGKNRTPAVIALDGKHWDERLKEPERKVTMGTDAVICPKCRTVDLSAFEDTPHTCRPRTTDDAARALARIAAAEARGDYERAMGDRAEAQQREAS